MTRHASRDTAPATETLSRRIPSLAEQSPKLFHLHIVHGGGITAALIMRGNRVVFFRGEVHLKPRLAVAQGEVEPFDVREQKGLAAGQGHGLQGWDGPTG